MLSPKKTWFRASSSLLAALTTFFLTGRELSEAASAERQKREAIAKEAKRLSLEPMMLENPKAHLAAERAKAEARRLLALSEASRFSQEAAQRAKAEAAKKKAEEIVASIPNARVRRELAEGRSLKLPEAALKARLAPLSPKLKRALDSAAPKKPALKVFSPRKAMPPWPAHPPPRLLPSGQRGGLTPELRALYASVAGEAVYVEKEDGSLLSVEEELLGLAPPPVRLASLVSDYGLGLPLLGVLPAPMADDLAQTPEVLQTPEVKALASSLGGRPLALYNLVRTKVSPELYYGSKKGAAQTLAEMAGNDFDQASLLIALLRASGVPARYEYGSVELSKEQAVFLTGAANAADAAAMLSKTAPATLAPGGETVLMERAWVRAYVPYGDYRGVGPGGESLWVRLDPGLKRASYTPGVNLKGVVSFDFDGYLSQATEKTPKDIFEEQLLGAAKAKSLCNALEDALGTARLEEEALRLLPAEHPAKVWQSLLVFSRPPSSMRHLVAVSLDGESKEFELAELEGRSLSLWYPGETPADELAIQAAGGIENVSPFQVSLSPSLRLDGATVQRFSAVGAGERQRLAIRVSVPGGYPALMTHQAVAGTLYALLVSGGALPASRVSKLGAALSSQGGDALLEAQAQLALATYAFEQERDSRRMFALQGHSAVKDVLEGVAGRELVVEELFGVPVGLSRGLYLLDIARDSVTPLPKDGDNSLVPKLTRLSGFHGSALEAKAWEKTLSRRAFSAVRVIQAAASQGVPVYKLSAGSSANRSKLVGYSIGALDDVDAALGAGWSVTIPERPVNYLSYQSLEGYILENPVDGSGAFRISSTINGGGCDGGPPQGGPNEGPPCSSCEKSLGSTVNLANGNWRESFVDLTLPGVGLPIVWARTYASQARELTEVGYGWSHSYGMHLRPELNGDVSYLTEDWREARFTKSGSSYLSPPGWHLALTATASGWQLGMKDGLTYHFDSAGRLVKVSEPSGNAVEVVWAGGLLSKVKDGFGKVALSFAHLGGKLSSVTDSAGRTVSYGHAGDDLVSATDVLGKVETYGYDSAHNLTSRTDRRGKVWREFYDGQDRWVGGADASGKERSAFYDVLGRRTVLLDRTGAARVVEYNASGNPLAEVDALGNRVEMSWDGAHHKLSEKDARGFSATMAYDGNGNLTERTEADGRVSSFTYESTFNRMLTQVTTSLPTITNTYDGAGRLQSRTDGLGTSYFAYDVRGQLSEAVAPGNAVTRFSYDGSGNLLSVRDGTLRTTTLGYDSAGHLTSVTDGNGKARAMEVDASGRVTAIIDALGARGEFGYDEAGNRTFVKDAEGNLTGYAYDELGRLVSVTDALGNVARTAYDAEGRVLAQTDARGFAQKTKYDAAGRVVEVTAADGAKTAYSYCADAGGGLGQPCCVVDAAGNVVKREFDAVGRVVKEVNGLSQVTATEYDSGGRVFRTSGPGQVPTTYQYGTHGLLELVTSGVLKVAYAYDGRGNRTQVHAGYPSGQVTSYSYDLANRLLSETNPIGKVTSYTYDGAGNRQTKTDGNGKVTTYAYDDNRRLLAVLFADGTRYEYGYDARGNRTLERAAGHERTLAYDELGRPQRLVDATLGRTVEYGYDAVGNRSEVSEGGLVQEYGYDAVGRLLRARGPGGSLAFDYDGVGRRTLVSRPNGVATSYSYGAAGEVTDIVHQRAGVVLASFQYGYVEGNRVSKRYADGTVEAYEYDGNDRLLKFDGGNGKRETYQLDALGNRTYQLYEEGGYRSEQYLFYNAFNQLTQTWCLWGVCPVTSYSYDGNGNPLSGRAGGQALTYQWDLDNRLKKVSFEDGSTSVYEYDANGLRTKRDDSHHGFARYLLDGPSVLEELDAAGSTRRSYLNNPQVIDEVLAFTESNGDTYYPLADALGSIYAVADSTGKVTRSYWYYPYGERTTKGTGPDIPFGFTGREHDLGPLNYHRDRYMAPRLGGWLTEDPGNLRALLAGDPSLGTVPPSEGALAADGANRYWYGASNPVSRTDPYGQSVGFWLVLAAVVVIAFVIATLVYRGRLIPRDLLHDEYELANGCKQRILDRRLPEGPRWEELWNIDIRVAPIGNKAYKAPGHDIIVVGDKALESCRQGSCDWLEKIIVAEFQHTRAGGSFDDRKGPDNPIDAVLRSWLAGMGYEPPYPSHLTDEVQR